MIRVNDLYKEYLCHSIQPKILSTSVLLSATSPKAWTFYQGVLGLNKSEELSTQFGTLHRLHFGTSDIKLIDPKQVPAAGPTGLEKETGFRYISFRVHDISALCVELQAKGVEFRMAETEIRPGVRMAMINDPDGNSVEFIQHG